MMQVLLVILKMIGIVLAVVLGLLLFLFLLLMLAPIGYNASGKTDEKLSIEGNLSWLFFVLKCKVKYNEEGVVWYFRILGFLFASNDKEFLAKKEEKKAAKETESVKPEHRIEVKEEASISEPEIKEIEEIPEPVRQEKAKVESRPYDKEEPKKVSVQDKIKNVFSSVKKFLVNVKEKITGIPRKVQGMIDKIQELKERFLQIKEFFLGEQNKEVMKFILLNLKKMILHILPNRFQGRVEFGLEDPYTMGQILAVLGILMPIYQDKLVVIPDFEEQKFKGDFSLKGTIIPGYLILRLLIIIANKEVRRVIKEGKILLGGKE